MIPTDPLYWKGLWGGGLSVMAPMALVHHLGGNVPAGLVGWFLAAACLTFVAAVLGQWGSR